MPKKFKKLTLQYAYLQLEKEEIDEACISVEEEMREYLKKHYPEHYETFYAPPPQTEQPTPAEITPEEEVEEEGTEDEEHTPSPPKNKDLRKLYRKIAEKTHPDKVGNNKYAQLFSEASQAYSKNDIAVLLNLAGTLNIELLELSAESLLLLENNINTLAMEIYKKKKTTAWVWHQSESEEQKEALIKQILILKGVEI